MKQPLVENSTLLLVLKCSLKVTMPRVYTRHGQLASWSHSQCLEEKWPQNLPHCGMSTQKNLPPGQESNFSAPCRWPPTFPPVGAHTLSQGNLSRQWKSCLLHGWHDDWVLCIHMTSSVFLSVALWPITRLILAFGLCSHLCNGISGPCTRALDGHYVHSIDVSRGWYFSFIWSSSWGFLDEVHEIQKV